MYEYKALITRVIDGDTVDAVIDLGFNIQTTTRLRLLGIDTPEKFGDTKEAGLIAKDYATKRLLNKTVVVKTQKIDVFGRWLAEIFISGKSFNTELLEKGYAVPYLTNEK